MELIIMEIEKIQMPKEKAKAEWRIYNDLIKKRHDKYLEDMKKSMYQLSKGRELIDIYKIMENAGVTKNFQPKLAIARADWKEVQFCKQDDGRGFFYDPDRKKYYGGVWAVKNEGDIDLRPQTFMQWARVKEQRKDSKDNIVNVDSWQIANEKCKTKIPIIPAQLIPDGNLSNYYILWEVQKWEDLPETKDPLLLKRITENLFVILGAWEVTPLEQSIISGR